MPQAVLDQRVRASQPGRRARSERMDPRFVERVSAQCDFCGDDDGGLRCLKVGFVFGWCSSGSEGRRVAVGRMDPRSVERVSAQCDICGDDDRGEPQAGDIRPKRGTPCHPPPQEKSSSSGLTRGTSGVDAASSSRQARPSESARATRKVRANGSPLCGASVRPARLLRG